MIYLLRERTQYRSASTVSSSRMAPASADCSTTCEKNTISGESCSAPDKWKVRWKRVSVVGTLGSRKTGLEKGGN